MAKYLALTSTFIAPHLIAEGQTFTIDGAWEPGPHVKPLDADAEKAMAAYLGRKETAGDPIPNLHPVEDLPYAVESIGEPPPKQADDLSLSFAEAQAQPAKPGPSDGGKVRDSKS